MCHAPVVCTPNTPHHPIALSSSEPYNYQRTVAAAAYGGLWFAPVMHNVFAAWSQVLPSTTLKATCFKVTVDMMTSFPVNITVLMSAQAMAKTEGSLRQRAATVMPALQTNFMPTFLDGMKLWYVRVLPKN